MTNYITDDNLNNLITTEEWLASDDDSDSPSCSAFKEV